MNFICEFVPLPTAVNGSNYGQSSVKRQERSIFDHTNGNFRRVGVLSENNLHENAPRENGVHRSASETVVSPSINCLPLEEVKRNVDASGMLIQRIVTYDKDNCCDNATFRV